MMMKNRLGLYIPNGSDPDALLFPTLDRYEPGDHVMRYRSLQDREFRKELRRARWADERGTVTLPVSVKGQFYLGAQWPEFIGAAAAAAVAVVPTGLGATTARVFPFVPEVACWIIKVQMQTSGVAAASMQLGVFDGAGLNRPWTSGTVATAANGTTMTPGSAFLLQAGAQYYWAITNANSAVGTNAYYFSPAFSAAGVVGNRWGTVAATSGAMPATISPGGITNTVGGFPIYTVVEIF